MFRIKILINCSQLCSDIFCDPTSPSLLLDTVFLDLIKNIYSAVEKTLHKLFLNQNIYSCKWLIIVILHFRFQVHEFFPALVFHDNYCLKFLNFGRIFTSIVQINVWSDCFWSIKSYIIIRSGYDTGYILGV